MPSQNRSCDLQSGVVSYSDESDGEDDDSVKGTNRDIDDGERDVDVSEGEDDDSVKGTNSDIEDGDRESGELT